MSVIAGTAFGSVASTSGVVAGSTQVSTDKVPATHVPVSCAA